MHTPENKDGSQPVERPGPSRVDTPAEKADGSVPPKAGSQEALDEARRTEPARTRG